jgi:DNA-binding NtrC family response regulator
MTILNKRILIIDDEANILKSLTRILEDKYEVITSLGCEIALDKLTENNFKYDVILCDLNMPTMNGADFYKKIAEISPELKERIIFMSGGTYTNDLAEFIADIKNICLEKPFELEKLYGSIEELLSTVN